jgi:hypothetical protein
MDIGMKLSVLLVKVAHMRFAETAVLSFRGFWHSVQVVLGDTKKVGIRRKSLGACSLRNDE